MLVSFLCHERDHVKHLAEQAMLLFGQALEANHPRLSLGQAPEALLASTLLFV